MTRYLAMAAALLAAVAAFLFWRLLGAHEALGMAELKAQLNANAVAVLQDQEQRNQAIDARLESLASARDAATKEIVREIYIQPSSDACRRSAPMRALDGRLRHQPGGDRDRPPATPTPAERLPAAGRSP